MTVSLWQAYPSVDLLMQLIPNPRDLKRILRSQNQWQDSFALLLKNSQENPPLSMKMKTTEYDQTPTPKPCSNTYNSQRTSSLEHNENQEDDNKNSRSVEPNEDTQWEGNADLLTDKENTTSKIFARKDPSDKFGCKNWKGSKEISTSRDTIIIKTYSIQRVNRKEWKFKGLWYCDVFKVLKSFNDHVKEKHSDVKYTCHFCDQEFQTYCGKRKHEVLYLPSKTILCILWQIILL